MSYDYSLTMEDKLYELREAHKDYDALDIYNFDVINLNPSNGNIILDSENTNTFRNMYESYCGQEECFQLFIKNIEYSIEKKNENTRIIPKTFGKDRLCFDSFLQTNTNILIVNFKIYFVDNLPYWNNFLKHNPEIKPFEIKVTLEKQKFDEKNIETNFSTYTDIKDIKYLKYPKWLSKDSVYASSLKNFVRVLLKFIEVFRKLPQPSVSPAASHPGYLISEDRLRYCRSVGSAKYRRDGYIQALHEAAE